MKTEDGGSEILPLAARDRSIERERERERERASFLGLLSFSRWSGLENNRVYASWGSQALFESAFLRVSEFRDSSGLLQSLDR
jgi:hypothetical protein